MLRWTFNIFVGISLLLMIASDVAWVRSASSSESIVKMDGSGVFMMGYVSGDYSIGRLDLPWDYDETVPWDVWSNDEWTNVTDWYSGYTTKNIDLGVFEYHSLSPADNHPFYRGFTYVVVPIWFITLLLTLMPTWWLLTYRKRCRR